MKVAIFGLGYVGVTSLCCIAREGHDVIGFDVSEPKVARIVAGISPIVEPDINDLLLAGLSSGRIAAYSTIDDNLRGCDLAFVCVGTPSCLDGSHDLTHIIEVTKQIARALLATPIERITVAYRSTIPPGTMQHIIEPVFRACLGELFERKVALVYYPEFLRESYAVADFFDPPRIVVGTKDAQPNPHLDELNKKIRRPTFYLPFAEAEFTKFVDNSWHAIKVAYANEIGRLCITLKLSAKAIHSVFVADKKLNLSEYYTRPGGAFGGSCLPKDVRALQRLAKECGADVPLIASVLSSNEMHKVRLLQLATQDLAPGSSVLLIGLAFKANTDDLRESPSVDLAKGLIEGGFNVSIYDPTIRYQNLVGANLDYARSQLPTLEDMLISRETAESPLYDRVILTAGDATTLNLAAHTHRKIVNLHSIP